MIRIARLLAGLRALTGRARHDQELDAELRDFLERSIDDKVRAGMSREAAERAARMELRRVPRGHCGARRVSPPLPC